MPKQLYITNIISPGPSGDQTTSEICVNFGLTPFQKMAFGRAFGTECLVDFSDYPSTMVEEVGYDEDTATLWVKFANSKTKVYAYQDVTDYYFNTFTDKTQELTSVGKAINQYIKPNFICYVYEEKDFLSKSG